MVEKTTGLIQERGEVSEKFRTAIVVLEKEVIRLIKERYENNPLPEWNFQYHNLEHAELVAQRSEEILRAIQANSLAGYVTERDVLLSQIIALSHDRIVCWEPIEMQDNGYRKMTMRRFVGRNEEDSINELIESMRYINGLYGEVIFTEVDKKKVREAILATVPAFDPELKTVVQPNLISGSSPITIALALSDIGSSALDPQQFAKEGDALFREENLDVFEDLLNGAKLTDQKRNYYAERMRGWTGFQRIFLKGRQAMLEKELGNLPEAAKDALRGMFNKFEESEVLVLELINSRSAMSFEELVLDMGYYDDSRLLVLKAGRM